MQKAPDACFNILHLIMLVSKISKEPVMNLVEVNMGRGLDHVCFIPCFNYVIIQLTLNSSVKLGKISAFFVHKDKN